MEEADKVFAGAIPDIYDRLLVPLIFEPYANDLAGRVAGLAPAVVLEIAAGTGALTRAIAPVLAADATLVASDLNAPMLARARARQGPDPRITWQEADALALPFADGLFDVVLCQFGVMFFPDKVRGYGQMLRVLKPGGHLLFNVWDALEANLLTRAVTDVLASVFPEDPPRFMGRTPHGYHDRDRIAAELAAAGFRAIEIETVARVARAASARDVAIALCQGTPLRTEIEERAPQRLADITDTVADALARHFGSGAVAAGISAQVAAARR